MKTKVLIGILAITLVLGMTACSDGGGGSGGTGGGGTGSGTGGGGGAVEETKGKLTITGLSAIFNGKYVLTRKFFSDYALYACASLDVSADKTNLNEEKTYGAKVSGRSVTLKVWKLTGTVTGTEITNLKAANYIGNDTVEFPVGYANNASGDIDQDGSGHWWHSEGTVTVTFKNGIGSGAFVPY